MTRDQLLRAVAYLIAGTVTAVTTFLASIPFTTPIDVTAITADAVVLVGLPVLHAADALARRLGGQP